MYSSFRLTVRSCTAYNHIFTQRGHRKNQSLRSTTLVLLWFYSGAIVEKLCRTSRLSRVYIAFSIVGKNSEPWRDRLCSNGHTIPHFFTLSHTFLHPFLSPTLVSEPFTQAPGSVNHTFRYKITVSDGFSTIQTVHTRIYTRSAAGPLCIY